MSDRCRVCGFLVFGWKLTERGICVSLKDCFRNSKRLPEVSRRS